MLYTLNPILITGCPRSGTAYMARLFTEAGIPCGHEQEIHNNKGQPMEMVRNAKAESSWLAVPYLSQFKDIIHITRNPFKVINSMLNVGFLDEEKGDIEYISQSLPEILEIKGIEQYVYFWTEWNKLIENHTKKRYNIEDINKDPRKFLSQYIEPKQIYKDTECNTWKNQVKYTNNITLNDIPDGEIKNNFIELKTKYNYD